MSDRASEDREQIRRKPCRDLQRLAATIRLAQRRQAPKLPPPLVQTLAEIEAEIKRRVESGHDCPALGGFHDCPPPLEEPPAGNPPAGG